MLMLKLQRTGKKHQASYRLIVGEKREKLLGEQHEYLGWYDPRMKKQEFNKDRVLYWLKVGAKPTDTVHNLLVSAGIIQGKKIPVHKQPRAAKDSKSKEVATPTAAPEPKKQEEPSTSAASVPGASPESAASTK